MGAPLDARSAARSAATKRRKAKRTPKRAPELGVTDEDYARMLKSQDGKCAIAGCNRTPKTRRLHVDHDHKTGQVRGLLCHWHNRIMPKTSGEAYALHVYLGLHERLAEFERKWGE